MEGFSISSIIVLAALFGLYMVFSKLYMCIFRLKSNLGDADIILSPPPSTAQGA